MKVRSAYIACVIIIIAGALLVFATLPYVNYRMNADEGFHFFYASHIADKGMQGFVFLSKAYANIKEWQVFPSPLRGGYIVLAALWLKIFGPSYLNVSFFSLCSYGVLLFLFFLFTKRYFGHKIAVWSLLLCAFSPLQMAFARRVLVESFVSMCLFGAFWSFFEYLKSRKLRYALLFVFTFSMSIASKEIYSVLVLVFLLYFFIHTRIFGGCPRLREFLMVLFCPLIMCGISYLFIAGDIGILKRLIELLLTQVKQPIGYTLLYASGPWFRYFLDFLILSPWIMILSTGYFFEYLTRRQWKGIIFYVLIMSVLSFGVLSCLKFKIIRFLLFIDPFMRLAAVLMLIRLTRRLTPRYWELILWGALLCIVAVDVVAFYNFFITYRIYDPVTVELLRALQIIPGRAIY